ncbi:hypothetical protein V6Z12_A07G238200 [Gossypium hirsutum]
MRAQFWCKTEERDPLCSINFKSMFLLSVMPPYNHFLPDSLTNL